MRTKRCPMCKKDLPLQAFMTRDGNPKYVYCKACTKEYVNRRAVAHLLKQPEKCAICEIVFDVHITPHCDHDHATGLFRDWLCQGCNKGLGMFEEDTERMQRAIDYIKKHFIEEADPNKF